MNRTKPRMRRINVTVPGELVARARAAGLNLSEVTRTALAQRLALSVDNGSTHQPRSKQSPLPSTGASRSEREDASITGVGATSRS